MIKRSPFPRISAAVCDWGMCTFMTVLQSRHQLAANSRELLDRYISDHAGSTRHIYYSSKPSELPARVNGSAPARILRWSSPLPTGFPENDRAHVDLYFCQQGPSAPTV